jgi:hypothetical protein
MTYFGLSHNGNLLGVSTTSNGDAEFCVSVAYELRDGGDTGPEQPWLVKDRAVAERVANRAGDWFNAGYEAPLNSYHGKCRVTEVELSFPV